jgi:Polyketide cyclase / dehydrase and lipid transport
VIVCPVAEVKAPAERVWSLLMDPTGYSGWTGAQVRRALPPGAVHRGQRIELTVSRLGIRVPVTFLVRRVEASAGRLAIDVRLPLGVLNSEVISVVPIDAATCRVSFG